MDSLYKRDLGDGCWIEVYRLTFGRARLITTDGMSVFRAW